MAVVQRGGDKRWIRFTLDRKYWRSFGFLAVFFQLWGATIFWISRYVTDYIIYVLGSDSNTNTSSFTTLPSISCPGLAEETACSGHHKSSETQTSLRPAPTARRSLTLGRSFGAGHGSPGASPLDPLVRMFNPSSYTHV